MKYKKAAAIILALMLALQPLGAALPPAHAFGAEDGARLAAFEDFDWKELAAHFSAFSGIFYWFFSTVTEAVENLKALEFFDVLSLLLRSGLLEDLFDLMTQPDPPGAVSI